MAPKKKPKAAKKPARTATKKAATKKAATKKTAKKGAKKTKTSRKTRILEMIISKSRTKNAVQNCNVSSDFYAALDGYVRNAIQEAEGRATANGRKTLRPQDL